MGKPSRGEGFLFGAGLSDLLRTLRQHSFQLGQRPLHRFPDEFQIRVEIAVRHAIVHTTQLLPRNGRICLREIRELRFYLDGRLADDDRIQHDGLLKHSFV